MKIGESQDNVGKTIIATLWDEGRQMHLLMTDVVSRWQQASWSPVESMQIRENVGVRA